MPTQRQDNQTARATRMPPKPKNKKQNQKAKPKSKTKKQNQKAKPKSKTKPPSPRSERSLRHRNQRISHSLRQPQRRHLPTKPPYITLDQRHPSLTPSRHKPPDRRIELRIKRHFRPSCARQQHTRLR